ncbi:MAG TPA: 1-deoxy-D-xylulose-5-phosphate reductoisomerase [Lachnospiraceae bacterium]|nr:1-deoxy-D-xylulose-5-phosphate reductoisomerase [Lachnospiraceae bacterium]
MRKLVVLGSTGSIGTQTLEVVTEQGDLEVFGLVAGSRVELLEKQIRQYKPKFACMWTKEAADDLKARIGDMDVTVLHGMDGIIELVTKEGYDVLVTAIVGMIGIRPTIAAINCGKTIALANKETLVTAGHIIMPLAKEKNVDILPVDSEHSAIFQSLNGEPKDRIKKIILTCSGGPFRGKKTEDLVNIGPADALKHPNWDMGRKITIDSASLVNKGLEVMEARWLFDVDIDHVQVVVHPQSILHSGVEFVDGALIGQMGVPDMKLPILYALYYPDRRPMNAKKLDLFEVGQMTFEKPDTDTFRGLALAIKAGKVGGSLPTVFNAANERAVKLFLEEKISFLGIYELIEECMDKHSLIANPSLDDILETEAAVYRYIDSKF